jgi:hypothetical protein
MFTAEGPPELPNYLVSEYVWIVAALGLRSEQPVWSFK